MNQLSTKYRQRNALTQSRKSRQNKHITYRLMCLKAQQLQPDVINKIDNKSKEIGGKFDKGQFFNRKLVRLQRKNKTRVK